MTLSLLNARICLFSRILARENWLILAYSRARELAYSRAREMVYSRVRERENWCILARENARIDCARMPPYICLMHS